MSGGGSPGGSGKGGSGGTDSNSEVAQARAEEQARQNNTRSGTSSISSMFDSQFNDQFYKDRAKSYEDYALPQLAGQTKDATKQLTFSLARRGALDSSSRSSLAAELERRRAIQETGIKNQGQDYANTARANVEGARSDLINTLNATGDQTAAINSANARAQVLSAVPGYSPVAQMFGDFTSALGKEAAAERAFALSGGAVGSRGTGLFAPRAGAVVNG